MTHFKRLKTKLISILILLIIVSVYILFFYSKYQSKQTLENTPIPRYRVVIDAGHGGIDGGAMGKNGTVEREINLQIAFEIENLFKSKGFEVYLTRKDENGLYDDTSPGFKKRDLQKRVEIVKSVNANIFISVHLNTYSSSSRRGAQVFFKKGNVNAKNLADGIQLELNLLKESKRMYDAITGDYFLLNALEIPAVIVECGFLSNPEEERLLTTKSYQKTLAKAIYTGTTRYFFKL